MAKWSHETRHERGIEDPVEFIEFVKGKRSMGLYETEDYINDLEELIKLLDTPGEHLTDVQRKRMNELKERHYESIRS